MTHLGMASSVPLRNYRGIYQFKTSSKQGLFWKTEENLVLKVRHGFL